MNVLVIMCDHHRYDALGCLGNRLAHTPNLDRLAAESTRFIPSAPRHGRYERRLLQITLRFH